MARTIEDLREALTNPQSETSRTTLLAELVARLMATDSDEEAGAPAEEARSVTENVLSLMPKVQERIAFHLDVARHLQASFDSQLAQQSLEAAHALIRTAGETPALVSSLRSLALGYADVQDSRWQVVAEEGLRKGLALLSQMPEVRVDVVELYLTLASEATDQNREQHAREALQLSLSPDDPSLVVRCVNTVADILLPHDAVEAEAVLERARHAATVPEGSIPSGAVLRWFALLNEARRAQGKSEHTLEHCFPGLQIDLTEQERVDSSQSEAHRFLARFFTRYSTATQALVAGAFDDVTSQSHGAVQEVAQIESEVLFGPKNDFVCGCGRYRGTIYFGIVCERCRVEVIASSTRRRRLGHIPLKRPMVHPWYVEDLAIVLQTSRREIESSSDIEARLSTICLPRSDIDTVWGPRARDLAALVEAFADAEYPTPTGPSCLLLTNIPITPPDADTFEGISRQAVFRAYQSVLDATPESEGSAVRSLFNLLCQPAPESPHTVSTPESPPKDLLWDIYWNLQYPVSEQNVDAFSERVRVEQESITGSSRWWMPGEIALMSPVVHVRFRCWNSSREEEPVVELFAPNGTSFTSAELFFSIATAIATHLTTTQSSLHDYHFFEGLSLVSGGSDGPLYQLLQGS